MPGRARLPGVAQLCRELQISPNTLNKALGALQNEGVIERRNGVGIFVSAEVPARTLRIAFLCDASVSQAYNRSPFWDYLMDHSQRRATERGENFECHFALSGEVPLHSYLFDDICEHRIHGILAVGLPPAAADWMEKHVDPLVPIPFQPVKFSILSALALSLLATSCAHAQDAVVPLATFDKVATVAGGKLKIDVASAQGGLGGNFQPTLDLSAQAALSPVFARYGRRGQPKQKAALDVARRGWRQRDVGARLSRLLRPYDAKLADEYRESAVRAFEFAEQDWKDDQPNIVAQKRETWNATDARNLAALELLKLTRDPKYHALFLQNTVLTADKPNLFNWGTAIQRDHAFIYATLRDDLADANLKRKARAGVIELAERALVYASDDAFGITTSDKGQPQFIGLYSTPNATELVHAHILTGERKYLAGIVTATQFGSGANPNNLVYTSGLGANPIKHPFSVDATGSGQKAPVGLTPYGNVDLATWKDNWIIWPITWQLSRNTTPNPYEWPVNQAHWDVGGWPALNEFTVDAWAPNVIVWGYLAARGKQKRA